LLPDVEPKCPQALSAPSRAMIMMGRKLMCE
jgi:hypothetical protein